MSEYIFWDEMWNVPPKSEEQLNKEENTGQKEKNMGQKE
jgi:hypothetical protein